METATSGRVLNLLSATSLANGCWQSVLWWRRRQRHKLAKQKTKKKRKRKWRNAIVHRTPGKNIIDFPVVYICLCVQFSISSSLCILRLPDHTTPQRTAATTTTTKRLDEGYCLDVQISWAHFGASSYVTVTRSRNRNQEDEAVERRRYIQDVRDKEEK